MTDEQLMHYFGFDDPLMLKQLKDEYNFSYNDKLTDEQIMVYFKLNSIDELKRLKRKAKYLFTAEYSAKLSAASEGLYSLVNKTRPKDEIIDRLKTGVNALNHLIEIAENIDL